jgi:hypothetical protein
MSALPHAQDGRIGIRRLAGNIGAEITGADISGPLEAPFLSDADVKVA